MTSDYGNLTKTEFACNYRGKNTLQVRHTTGIAKWNVQMGQTVVVVGDRSELMKELKVGESNT